MNQEQQGMTLYRLTLQVQTIKVNAFCFFPERTAEFKSAFAIFAHGYTSHKGSLLNWGNRLAEKNIPTCIFDLPGHYLGSFHEVDSFEEFTQHAPALFVAAYQEMLAIIKRDYPLEKEKFFQENDTPTPFPIILGGHSLGALLSLKSLSQPAWTTHPKMSIGVGFGFSYDKNDRTHLFETDFYKKTLELRSQLVSPEIAPDKVFPWIKAEKENLELTGQDIYLLTGQDDMVSPPERVQELAQKLTERKNQVTVDIASKLPHHQPELAASYLMKYIKKSFPELG